MTDKIRWCIVHKSEAHADAWPPAEYCQDAYYQGKSASGECVIVAAVVEVEKETDDD